MYLHYWPGVPIDGRHAHRSLAQQEYIAMAHAFGPTGGMSTGDALARRVGEHCSQPISVVARWIVDREALAFRWNGDTLLPLFQFDLRCLTPRREVQGILRELSGVHDAWGSALWFVKANPWLGDQPPVDLLYAQADRVVEAARVERFIARG